MNENITKIRIDVDNDIYNSYKKNAKKNGIELGFLNKKLFERCISEWCDDIENKNLIDGFKE